MTYPYLHAGVGFACLREPALAEAGHAGVSVIRVLNPFSKNLMEEPSAGLPYCNEEDSSKEVA